MEGALDRSDLRSPGEAGLDEERKMERLVQAKVDAIENIVVAGSERKYLVCIFTLSCEPNTNLLSDRSVKFMEDCGSLAHVGFDDAHTLVAEQEVNPEQLKKPDVARPSDQNC
eukprot:768013-Hanusia_phi.AAC.1